MSDAAAMPMSEPYALRINRNDPHLVASDGRAGHRLPATRILGVPVSVIDMPMAVRTIIDWALTRRTSMICVRDVHGIMCAQEQPDLRAAHERASMITPDGAPLTIISRLLRAHGTGRVPGPTLMEEMFAATQGTGIRHYLYGGKEGVAEQVAANFARKYPGSEVCGLECPPFGTVSPERDAGLTDAIRRAEPHIVWVGMSTPKQDIWMNDHLDRLPGMVLIGVGAAFDFHSGAVKRAPKLMQALALEWLHRLMSEPRRLWRRYLVMAPAFLWKMARQPEPRNS
ncbi:WecB/TagA/CpsF family glycosyltransferase [Methylobacterium sp. B4]|uniref:WecB/TagA/CpsF family glycosyltransferase n=1 Tax=Methylobacterium sp. B4 TaxID=1938755 RepID=UPI000D9375AA|nr:WecB/TagA/CpsF family glycosyltransferase [Methylobacterium sp. B4]PXW64181.1 exopolysaccharide biosynthesis WecB/TagA/CpsF family protein [Methylobacterium sp. B4]